MVSCRWTGDGAKRNVEIPHPDSVKEYELSVAASNATYKMIDTLEQNLSNSIDACYEGFYSIGCKFFASKNATQQSIRESVFREINNSARGTDDSVPAPSSDGEEEN